MKSEIKPRDIKATTPLDRILKSWLAHDLESLSDEDKGILQRITEIDKRIREGMLVTRKKNNAFGVEYEANFTRPMRFKELVDWHTELFQISSRQAYVDIAMAKQFFLSTESRDDKEFARGQMIQQGEEMMFEAASQSDFKSAASFFKELRLLRGLDKFDADAPDLSKWEPLQPRIVSDPSELGFDLIENPDAVVARLKKSFKKGVVEKMLDDAEEIENEPGN